MEQILVSPTVRIEVPTRLRRDENGFAFSLGIIVSIIGIMITMVIVTALFPTYLDALTDFDNATTNSLAPVLVTLGTVLLIVGLILMFVFAFIGGSKTRSKR